MHNDTQKFIKKYLCQACFPIIFLRLQTISGKTEL